MGFTTPCFIYKNTLEIQGKLKILGYVEHPMMMNVDTSSQFLICNRGFFAGFPLGYKEEINNAIDCGTNEGLFLSIAALRDDTDNNQMFINGKGDWGICRDNTEYGGLSGIDFYGMPNDLNVDNYHKATVEELIEHFKGKEEI